MSGNQAASQTPGTQAQLKRSAASRQVASGEGANTSAQLPAQKKRKRKRKEKQGTGVRRRCRAR